MGYYVKQNKRKYISIYFEDRALTERKKKDLTIAFSPTEPLYQYCKKFGSSDIKGIINIHSYEELVRMAQTENRTLSNFIKHKLKEKLF